MSRCLALCALAGLLMAGCSGDSTQSDVPSSDAPSMSDPHAGMLPIHGTHEATAGRSLGDDGGPVELDAITLSAPAGWMRMPPSSSFVAAEFSLPRAAGDDADGRLTVSTAGGTVEANVERWKGQFGPQAVQEPAEDIDVAGLKLTVVDLSGDFQDQRGPFAPAVERPGYRMIAAIVPVDGQLHFIKATGAQNTIAAHADEIHQFIRSIQRKQ